MTEVTHLLSYAMQHSKTKDDTIRVVAYAINSLRGTVFTDLNVANILRGVGEAVGHEWFSEISSANLLIQFRLQEFCDKGILKRVGRTYTHEGREYKHGKDL